MKNKTRIVYIDALRIMACFFVIVNHTVSITIQQTSNLTHTLSLGWFFCSKIAVPTFVMITGALMLKSTTTYKSITKKVFKVLCCLFVFSFVYCFVYTNDNQSVINIVKQIFLNVFQDGITNSFWYLYLYVGILLMMPLLQKMQKQMTTKDYYYLFIVSFISSSIIPFLSLFVPILKTGATINLSLFNGYIGLLFAGDYIANKMTINKSKTLFSFIIGIIVITLSVLLVQFVTTFEDYHSLDNVMFPIIIVPTITAFIIIKHSNELVCTPPIFKNANIISVIGKHTFGIYLISDIIIFKFKFIYDFLCNYMNNFVSVILYEIFIFVLCFMVVFLLKKIPIINKLF